MLTEEQIKESLQIQEERVMHLPDGYRVRVAAVSQGGYNPTKDKTNQDSFCIHNNFGGGGRSIGSVFMMATGW